VERACPPSKIRLRRRTITSPKTKVRGAPYSHLYGVRRHLFAVGRLHNDMGAIHLREAVMTSIFWVAAQASESPSLVLNN
jgi:hypothetical protein